MVKNPSTGAEGPPPTPHDDVIEEIRGASLNIGTFALVIDLVKNMEQTVKDSGTSGAFNSRDIADFKVEINIVHKDFLDRITPVSPAATAALFPKVLKMNPFMTESDKATYTEKWKTKIYPTVRGRLEAAIRETQPTDATTKAYWEKQLRDFLSEAGE